MQKKLSKLFEKQIEKFKDVTYIGSITVKQLKRISIGRGCYTN